MKGNVNKGNPNKGNKGHGGGGNQPKQPKPGTMGYLKKLVLPTPQSTKGYIHSAAQLQYGPQARQVKAEQRASQLQTFRLQKYFPQYLKSLKPLQNQTTQAYNQAASGIASDNAALGAYAASQNAQLASEGQASAAARGVGYVPSTDAAQAAVARYQTGNTLGGVVRAQGASQRSYLTDQKRIGKREMIDALQQQFAQSRSYNQDIQNLQRQKGASAAQAKNDLLTANRSFYLGLRSANTAARNAKISAQTTRRGQNMTAATSIANSKRTARSSRLSSKRTAQNNIRTTQTSRADSRRTARTARYVHNHPAASSTSGVVSGDVRRALAYLRGATAPQPGMTGQQKQTAQQRRKLFLNDRQAAIDALRKTSETISTAEAARAYKQWAHQQGAKGAGPFH